LFFSNADYKRVSAGADENSSNPGFGVRSVFAWKKDFGQSWSNEVDLGTELQQSRSLVSSYRFTGTTDSVPGQVQPITAGSYFRTVTNQQSVFVHERLTYKPWQVTLFLGVSGNHIAYRRTDLLAAPGLLNGYNKDLSFDKSFETAINPHVALQKSWRGQIFQLSYSRGYNAPTAATAFISTINVANDDLKPERAGMIELSAQGLLAHTAFDYQVSVFSMDVTDKLTQLNGKDPATGTAYSYWANTGRQRNAGAEASMGYAWVLKPNKVLAKVEPFVSASYYQFKYTDFKTKFGTGIADYTDKQVVGVPQWKYTVGLDLTTPQGIYLNNTYNYIGEVYTDFANTNEVKPFGLYNAKIGYRHSFAKARVDLDVYAAGNNLTNQINYTFLFLGNNVNDSDPGSNYPKGVATDVNPGPSQAWFFGGFTVKYRF
jgi:iron complex outermembrane receptor protein